MPMLAILPVSLLADDTAGAILRSNGTVLVNKQPAPVSSAIYRDDLIETREGATARIQASGSMADINPKTMLQYENGELALDHGSLEINTSGGWKVRVGCIMVAPTKDAVSTRYGVADMNGRITVLALSGDVYIDTLSSAFPEAKQPAHPSRTIVHQGEQISRNEKCGADESTQQPAIRPILDSIWAKGVGLGAIGVLTCWALCRSGAPVSPSDPSQR
jgi:hypothetical protein